MLKNITINKRKEVKAATYPTHDIVASDENYQNKAIVGAMWTRVAKDEMGNDYKFLSGTFSKTRIHEGKEYDGYVLITERAERISKVKKRSKVTRSKGRYTR